MVEKGFTAVVTLNNNEYPDVNCTITASIFFKFSNQDCEVQEYRNTKHGFIAR